MSFLTSQQKILKPILSDSALSQSSKRTILTQECVRLMRNTKVELGETVRNEHILKLKNLGCSKKFGLEILNSAANAFEKMLDDDKKNVKPLF